MNTILKYRVVSASLFLLSLFTQFVSARECADSSAVLLPVYEVDSQALDSVLESVVIPYLDNCGWKHSGVVEMEFYSMRKPVNVTKTVLNIRVTHHKIDEFFLDKGSYWGCFKCKDYLFVLMGDRLIGSDFLKTEGRYYDVSSYVEFVAPYFGFDTTDWTFVLLGNGTFKLKKFVEWRYEDRRK